MRRVRRIVGRIERRLNDLPAYVLIVGGMLFGMFLTFLGESPVQPLTPRKDEVWFPVSSGQGRPALVVKAPARTCRKGDWESRRIGEQFLAVKVLAKDGACTCLESLAVTAERGTPIAACEAGGQVSYGAH